MNGVERFVIVWDVSMRGVVMIFTVKRQTERLGAWAKPCRSGES